MNRKQKEGRKNRGEQLSSPILQGGGGLKKKKGEILSS